MSDIKAVMSDYFEDAINDLIIGQYETSLRLYCNQYIPASLPAGRVVTMVAVWSDSTLGASTNVPSHFRIVIDGALQQFPFENGIALRELLQKYYPLKVTYECLIAKTEAKQAEFIRQQTIRTIQINPEALSTFISRVIKDTNNINENDVGLVDKGDFLDAIVAKISRLPEVMNRVSYPAPKASLFPVD